MYNIFNRNNQIILFIGFLYTYVINIHRNAKVDFSADSSFKKVYFPSITEYILIFLVNITDTIFLAKAGQGYVNSFAIFNLANVIAILSCMIVANISCADFFCSKVHKGKKSKQYIFGRSVFITLIIGLFFSTIYIIHAEWILSTGGIDDSSIQLSTIYFKILSINILFLSLRQVARTINSIMNISLISLISALGVLLGNLLINTLVLFILIDNLYYYVVAISLSTLLCQSIASISQIVILVRKRHLELGFFTYFNKEDIENILSVLRSGLISSLEVASYNIMAFCILSFIANISPSVYYIRNATAPFFLIITANMVSWSILANVELSKLIKNGYYIKANEFSDAVSRISAFYSAIGLFFMALVISPFYQYLLDINYSWILMAIVLPLSLIEIIRCYNSITLTILRLNNNIGRSTILSLCSYAFVIVLVLSIREFVPRYYFNDWIAIGLIILLLIDELNRTIVNRSIAYQKYPLGIIKTPSELVESRNLRKEGVYDVKKNLR
ncbi:MATE family efflux transporter [Nitrincola sp. MINF-07-Sa-05]|uniref:MATE family efflux transporter n=1 Tax=Nitrincola salilacus TaxID=3400273 RepID=UPI003917DD91